MIDMYKGIPFSPQVALADSIGAGDTVIKVTDISAFPPAPNYATIGTDETGETILYAAIAGDSLSGCTRAIEGTAQAWPAGSTIARNFTSVDMDALQANIREVSTAAGNAQITAGNAQSAAEAAQGAANAAGSAAQAAQGTANAAQTAAGKAQSAAEAAQGTANAAQTAAGNAQSAAEAAQGTANAAQTAAGNAQTAAQNAQTAAANAQTAAGNAQTSAANAVAAAEISNLAKNLAGYNGKNLGLTYTPATFKEKVKSGDFSGLELGDYFDITLTTGEQLRAVISGFNTYLNWGDTPLTENHVIMTTLDCLKDTKQMKGSNDNTGGYANSLMPAYLEGVLSTFPSAWKSVIRSIRRLENNKSTWAWASRSLFLLSETEVHGGCVWSDGYDGGTRPLPLYQFSARYRIKGLGFGSSAQGSRYIWWLASPNAANTTHFCNVINYGPSTAGGASNSRGVAPGFCI